MMEEIRMFQSTVLRSGYFLLSIVIAAAGSASAQWQPDLRLTHDPSNSFMSYNNSKCLAASGDFLHVVSFDDRDGNAEIYYKRSTDGGISWGGDVRLTNDPAASNFPSVAVSGQNVHVVWQDCRDGWEIFYKRSTNAGLNWSADIRLTNNGANSLSPSVTASGQKVHVVWQDERDGNKEIYYKTSPDDGLDWGNDTRLTSNSAPSILPSVTVSGQVVNVVWEEYRDGANGEIYYKRSGDGGKNWGADTRLTNHWARSLSPAISSSGSIISVVWFDERDGNGEIYDKRSNDGGQSWEPDMRLTNNWAASRFPSVFVSGSSVHVVWQDERDGNFEIYHKYSADGGSGWGPDLRLTNNWATSIFPYVSVSGTVVHIIWEEYRDSNPEIYYKRNPTGNAGTINVNLKMIVEGFYNVSADCLNMRDTVTAYLRNASSPFNSVDSAKAVIDMNHFTGNFYFLHAGSGTYYIALNHRNSLQTWSRGGGESFIAGSVSSYDFTVSGAQAFGNNLKLKGTRWTIFSGDVDKNGVIDITDLGEVDDDVFNYEYGYRVTDLNGDNNVDLADLSIADNNVFDFVSMIRP